jgi:hypothetical protein
METNLILSHHVLIFNYIIIKTATKPLYEQVFLN